MLERCFWSAEVGHLGPPRDEVSRTIFSGCPEHGPLPGKRRREQPKRTANSYRYIPRAQRKGRSRVSVRDTVRAGRSSTRRRRVIGEAFVFQLSTRRASTLRPRDMHVFDGGRLSCWQDGEEKGKDMNLTVVDVFLGLLTTGRERTMLAALPYKSVY